MTWSDASGVIDLGWGRCTLTADDNTLVLHAEAPDDADLKRLQALLSARLEQFGRRDDLTVDWHSATPIPVHTPPVDRLDDVGGARRRRPHRGTVALLAVGVLVVGVHLGLGAAAVASPAWAGWALGVVLAVVVVKLLTSILLGRRLLHHRRRPSRTEAEASEQPGS